MNYQSLWFELKEELIEFRNKGDMNINDLIEKMDIMEIAEFNSSKLPKIKLNNKLRCNLCDGELYYTGNATLGMPMQKEYRCKKCGTKVFR